MFSDVILKTELYRTAVAEYPSLFLSETCEIINVSESFRSCCADNASRTFLAEVFREVDYRKLKVFCMESRSDTLICKMHYLKYRYALLLRVAGTNKDFTILFILETVKDAMVLKAYLAGLMSAEAFASYCRKNYKNDCDFFGAFRMLMSPYSHIFVRESMAYLYDLSAKLTRRCDLFPYRLSFCQIGEWPANDVRVHVGGLSTVIASLMGVLGPLSKNGDVIFKVGADNGILRIKVSTELPYDIKLRGETENLTDLARHVPVSFSCLLLAELAAVETDMKILLRCTESHIVFIAELPLVSDSSLRFNYRDTQELAESVAYLLCSVFTPQILSVGNQE